MATDKAMRDLLARLLSWEDAHVGFDEAVADMAEHLRGRQVSGLHSPWELLEHLRITQHDILDFSVNPDYQEMSWPKDYWPGSPAPPSPEAWDESVAQFKRDRDALQVLAANPDVELTARIPHGDGQTYVREILLAADHSSYHLGQFVLVRQLLGAWKRQ